MLALRKTKPGFGLELHDIAEPREPAAGEVVLRVEAVGICGSDVHAYEWTDGYGFMVPHLPVVMGHEFAGRVAAVGLGVSLPINARVTVAPAIACGVCASCRRDMAGLCEARRTVGLTQNGGFASHVTLPASACIALPDAVDTELAALTEPLGVGCDAVLTAGVGLGDVVLVLGPGTIGQAIALMARAAGAGRVLIAGRADAPRFDVLRALGFMDILDVAEAPLSELVMRATGGHKVDVVLEATGYPPSVTDGLSVLRKAGVLAVVGIHPGPVMLPLTDFVRARHQLRASHGTARPTFDRVVAMLAREPETFRPLITHRLPLDRAIEGFELARQRAASKVILRP